MKILSFILIAGILVACNNNNQLCDCVEAGQEVNRISASFFDRPATQEGKDSLDLATQKRDEICAPFQNMMPGELHEKAAECESLKFSAED